MKGYKITTHPSDFDFEVIYQYISTSYWAKNIPRTTMQKAIENSLCFGVLEESGKQVGFARLITDKATFAYLADVFIVESSRGIGLSKWLMETIMSHPDVPGLRRLLLATRDAHSLYAQYGFKSIDNPQSLMQVWQPDIYNQSSD